MNFQPMIDFMDRLTSWRIPGNAIKVCVDNKEVFSYASGYSNLEKKVKMTGDKLINIYSCSKVTSALTNSGVGQTGERILAKGTIELLKANQLNDTQQKYFNWEQLKGYGYGLGVRTMVDRAMSGSNGSVGEFGWGGAAGATVLVDTDRNVSLFYAHHMLNPQEDYYQPRLRNVLYTCLNS